MRVLPRRVWHAIHLSSYARFVSATMHAIAAGPDTGTQEFDLALSAIHKAYYRCGLQID